MVFIYSGAYLFIRCVSKDYVDVNPSETSSCTTAYKFAIYLWNLKVFYYVHKSSQQIPIMKQTNPVHTFTS
jgi:hypothetical protein